MHVGGGHLHLDVDAVVPPQGDHRQGAPDGRPQALSGTLQKTFLLCTVPLGRSYEMNVDRHSLQCQPSYKWESHIICCYLNLHISTVWRRSDQKQPKNTRLASLSPSGFLTSLERHMAICRSCRSTCRWSGARGHATRETSTTTASPRRRASSRNRYEESLQGGLSPRGPGLG